MRFLIGLIVLAAGCGQPPREERAPEPVRKRQAPPARSKELVRPFRMGRPDVVLLFTGTTNGVLEPCNCDTGPTGGLSRRAGLVEKYRNRYPRTFLFDTGDALRVTPAKDPRNAYLLRGYRKIGYDALVLGIQEWSLDPDALGELARSGTPFLSTTVTHGRVAAVKVVKREWGATKLAFVSSIREDVPHFVPAARAAQLRFAPPAELDRRVAELKRAGYVVVAVPHGVDAQLEETARTCKADVFVQGHVQVSHSQLARVAGRPAAKVGGVENLGVLALRIRNGAVAAVEYRVESVDKRWPLDEGLIDTYTAYTGAAMRYELAKPRRKGLAYVAPAVCGECHEPELLAWKKTPHGHAYRTLVDKGRQGDPDCLSCHTTGFGTVHGFRTVETTPRLVDVNCQACHRFGLDEHQGGKTPAPRVGEQVCLGCHTKLTDPRFTFAVRRGHVGCVAGH